MYIGNGTPPAAEYVASLDLVFLSNEDVRVTLECIILPAMPVNLLSPHTVQANQNTALDATGVHLLGGRLSFPKDRAGSRQNATRLNPLPPPMPYA